MKVMKIRSLIPFLAIALLVSVSLGMVQAQSKSDVSKPQREGGLEANTALPSGMCIFSKRSLAARWDHLSAYERKTLVTTLNFIRAQQRDAADTSCGADETGWTCVGADWYCWCDHTDSGPDCGCADL